MEREGKMMPKTYHFSEEQVAEVEAAKKKNKDKNVDKRLEALLLRANGVKRAEVSVKTGFCKQYITDLTSKYHQKGISAIVENQYIGNNRNLSFEEEAALLNTFKKAAESGQLVSVSDILAAYEAKIGRSTAKDHGRIYRVLARHGWRKVMPRIKHPNKASDEAIEATKKLT
jgi:transposase